jgi:predicted RNase H-like HicB family nuclease
MDDTPSEIERHRRALQEAIDSAKQAIEQTLDLIERTRRTLELDPSDADPDSSAQGNGSSN